MPDIDRAWALLTASFPRWFIQRRTRAAWTELLIEDLEPQDILAGARTLAKSCKYQQPNLSEWGEHALRAKRARLSPPPPEDFKAVERAWMERHATTFAVNVPGVGKVPVHGIDRPFPGYVMARTELRMHRAEAM